MTHKLLKEPSSLSSELTLEKHHSPVFSLYHKKRPVEFTSERMDGEGLMGLNNVHLERKINGAAARQKDSTSNAADGQKQKYIFFSNCLTTMHERKSV